MNLKFQSDVGDDDDDDVAVMQFSQMLINFSLFARRKKIRVRDIFYHPKKRVIFLECISIRLFFAPAAIFFPSECPQTKLCLCNKSWDKMQPGYVLMSY